MINWTGVKIENGQIVLKELTPDMILVSEKNRNPDDSKNVKIGIIDLECNGLDYKTDEPIEIGIKKFLVNKDTGLFIEKLEEYTALQEIKEPLKQKVINITNLTDDMLKGHNIDWSHVNDILDDCTYIIAHNAMYDRGFVDSRSMSSSKSIWGCSLTQIDWVSKGFHSASLPNLCLAHGFFYTGHRALNDIEATAYLLQQKAEGDSHCYLKQLLDQVDKPQKILIAHKYPNDKKQVLKDQGFIWAGEIWCWVKVLFDKSDLHKEIKWLEQKVYGKDNYSYYVEIEAQDNYKPYGNLAIKYKDQFKQKTSENKDFYIEVKVPKFKKDLVKNRDKTYRFNWDTKKWYAYGSEEEIKAEKIWMETILAPQLDTEAQREMDIKTKKAK